jgi:hypothetical protein
MEKVLLAIDGVTPDKQVFRYALQLCRRIKAELDVLQVIKPTKIHTKAGKKTGHARKYIEGSLMAAAFAEAGDHQTAKDMMSEALDNLKKLLPESDKAGIRYHLTAKAGSPKIEILNHVNEHRDIVLAIYDTGLKESLEKTSAETGASVLSELKQALSIPLVVIHPESHGIRMR